MEILIIILLYMSRDVQAIIFVIDSSDKFRMPVVKDELDNLLQNPGEKKTLQTGNGTALIILSHSHTRLQKSPSQMLLFFYLPTRWT